MWPSLSPVADTTTAAATGRTVYRGAAIGDWVVVLICTAVGPEAAAPAVIGAQLGAPASLVARSWENRVMVFSSDAGHRLAQIDAPAFCRVVAKVLPP